MALQDYVELVRLPAVMTAPGDVLAGAAAAGTLRTVDTLKLVGSSACLYLSGMALNDYADRALDAEERPERPIPSGRISPKEALALASGLSVAGLALAGSAGRQPLKICAALTGAVWCYDMVAKSTIFGPVVMGGARFLNVLLGGHADLKKALFPASLTGAHIVSVTALSRGEVHGSTKAVATSSLITTTAVSLTAIAAQAMSREALKSRIAAAVSAALYGVMVGREQLEAVEDPSAGPVRKATGAGIKGLMPLQASLIAGTGAIALAVGVLSARKLLQIATRVVSPT